MSSFIVNTNRIAGIKIFLESEIFTLNNTVHLNEN